MSQGYGYRSEQRLRKENQDTLGVFEFDGFTLLVVCDGMGGHVGGAQASALAVRTLHDELSETSAADLPGSLARAVESANRAIYEEARRNYKLMGMGTTVVAAAVVDDTAHLVHVGDSRIYLARDGVLKALTRDHTMVNLFVDAELLSPEDAATHPEAHVLSRSLGVERQVDVEVSEPIPLEPDDRLLLCSDGVHGVVDEVALADIDWGNPQRGTDIAMEAVAIGEGDDNASLVVFGLDIDGASASPTPPPDPEAVARAVRDSAGGTEVQPVSAGAAAGASATYDDVAPIEELDVAEMESASVDAIAAPPPPAANKPPAAKPTRTESYVKAAVALGALGVIGLGTASFLFGPSSAPESRPVPVAAAPSDDAETTAMADGEEAEAAIERPAIALPVPRQADAEREPVEDAAEGVADIPPERADGQSQEETAAAVSAAIEAATDVIGDTDAVAAMLDADPIEAVAVEDVEVEGEEPAEIDPYDIPRTPSYLHTLTSTWSYGPPPVELYLPNQGSGATATTLFAPDVPNPPKRAPHSAARYDHPAPRGPEQAAAIRAARDQNCKEATEVVAKAMSKSVDYASLFRTSWLCFNDADQSPLRRAEAVDFDALAELLPHFEGSWDAPAGSGDAGGKPPVSMPYDVPATGGLEYRLNRFESDTSPTGFQVVVIDLLGEPTVADHLGSDLFLEATAAASLSRLDNPTDDAVNAWARRVHVVASMMKGPIGDLIREHRADLSQVIETLMFEATGGDDGREALQRGEGVEAVPFLVTEAWAAALGRPAPSAPVLAQNDDNGRSGTSSSSSRRRSTPRTAPAAASSAPAAAPSARSPGTTTRPLAGDDEGSQAQEGDDLVIKVYKRKPEELPRRYQEE